MPPVDLGHGDPVVIIPGIQGRWEWMRPGVEALARQCRVLTFSLADERGSGAAFDPDAAMASYVAQVAGVLDRAGVARACICGVSYGGLIAAAFAARHPERTTSLVFVSALPPSWEPDARVRFYLRAPRLLAPLFCAASLRLLPEIAAAFGGMAAAIRPAIGYAVTALVRTFSPRRMARRARHVALPGLDAALRRLQLPVLVVTGDPGRDRVVPVERTREYLRLCPHAETAVIERTGHLGVLTRPDEFARLVAPFVQRTSERESRRRVG